MADIDDLRKRIDHLDEKILALLASRFAISQQIGELKTNLDIDKPREQTILDNLVAKSPSLDVDKQAVDEIWAAILESSRRAQKRN